ncbi:MAG: VirD4-like conjugal transfer protein, CD1115 family [Deltaproteobacteria bacterium]
MPRISSELKKRLIIYGVIVLIICTYITSCLAVAVASINEENKKLLKDKRVTGVVYIVKFQEKTTANLTKPFDNLGKVFTNEDVRKVYFEFSKLAFLLLFGLFAFVEIKQRMNKNEYQNVEHGSSAWAKGEEYEILNKEKGLLLGVGKYLDIDSRKINKNVLVFGGAGSRKSRGYVMPNILNMLGSYVITDPKGELYDTTAGFLKANGYDVKVFNLVNPDCSDNYNPLAHVRTNIDVDIIADSIIDNTNAGAKSEDPFWPLAEKALLKSCIYYICSKCPPEEQSLASCLALVRAGADFDLMDNMFMELPFDHMGRKNYETFRLAVDKTRAGVLVGLATRLNPFDTPEIAGIMGANNIDIEALGKKKTAIFCITPDSHSTFNFLATMFFGQILQRLYDVADKNGGSLEVPVFFLLDEFANTGRIPDFNQKISTSRSRRINISIILQSLDQLIDLYKDIYENIISNCDVQLFLGSQALKTCEYISKSLGETTISKKTESYNTPFKKGLAGVFSGSTPGSFSMTSGEQSMARTLMTIDELKRLDLWTEIIMIKGINPIKCRKYDIAQHSGYNQSVAAKIHHNEIKTGNRPEWRIFNPYDYSPEENGNQEITDEELEKRFDELFNIV